MRSNINKVAERGEKLEDIGERAGNIDEIVSQNVMCKYITLYVRFY